MISLAKVFPLMKFLKMNSKMKSNSIFNLTFPFKNYNTQMIDYY
jgi:hypothetical protein